MLTDKAAISNEISQLVIERDAAFKRLGHDQTEKERLQVRISDLEAGEVSFISCTSTDTLFRRAFPKNRRRELQVRS